MDFQQEIQAYLEKARQRSAREPASIGFTTFKRTLYRRYLHGDHLEQLDAALTQVTRYVETGGRDGIGRLIVAMPPRHGKSLTVSRFYPAWHIGRNPDHRIILVSYGSSLAEKHSRYVRNLIAAPAYREVFPHIALAPDSKAVDAWDVAGHEGGMDALGIGGAATGKGAHVLVIDDPIKNREEAESQTIRDKLKDAYTDDLYTRLEPGGAVILMATRWHVDDLTGWLMLNEPDGWHTLVLPAIDADGRALWEARYPLPVLRDIERTLGAYSFASLYQQQPVPAEGGLFKRAWFEPPVTTPPAIEYAVRYWDLAMSEKTSADYTVGVKYGMGADGHRYVLDVTRAQVDWGQLPDFMARVMVADGIHVAQGIENKGYMSRAIAALNVDERLLGYVILGYDVDRDKVTRALPLAAKAGAGLVHVLASHWTDAFLDELTSFPLGAHDDQVDAAAGAETMLADGAFAGMGEVYTPDEPYISGGVY